MIHSEIEKGIYVPTVFVYLPGKFKECYNLMWQMLRDALHVRNLDLAAEYINSDYELNIRTTWQDNFNIPSKGCSFHYGQCLMKKINTGIDGM